MCASEFVVAAPSFCSLIISSAVFFSLAIAIDLSPLYSHLEKLYMMFGSSEYVDFESEPAGRNVNNCRLDRVYFVNWWLPLFASYSQKFLCSTCLNGFTFRQKCDCRGSSILTFIFDFSWFSDCFLSSSSLRLSLCEVFFPQYLAQ